MTHAFVVQEQTLPVGTEVAVTRTNDLRRGGSRIVPLRRGEMRAEHFAVTACTPAAMAEIELRRKHMANTGSPRSATAADLPIEASGAPARSSRGAAGIATSSQMVPGMFAEPEAADAEAPLATKAAAATRRQPLSSLVRSLDNAPGFLDLADGEVLGRRTVNIRVKGKADLSLSLMLNGRELGTDRSASAARGNRQMFRRPNSWR